jgi:septal ring factor EnvC (AmiA/AmiB activator)
MDHHNNIPHDHIDEADDVASNKSGSAWIIDKHIPVASVALMIGQIVCIAWWASGINQQMQNVETRLAAFEHAQDEIKTTQKSLAVLEERLKNLQDNTSRTNDLVAELLDRLNEYRIQDDPTRKRNP